MSRRKRNFGLRAAFAFTALVAATGLPAAAQSAQRLVRIGAQQLFLSCSGQRHGAVVILEAGRGRTSDDWSKVQPAVARYTEVCSYDRAGLGRSLPHAAQVPPDDVTQSIDGLHRLLAAAPIEPPFLMVGHSLGGLYVRHYQAKYPTDVKGLVFVDPAHDEQLWRALDIDPEAIHGVSLRPDDIRRGGFLPPREHLVWRADIPLVVIRHGQPIDLPLSLKAKSAQFEAMFIALDEDLVSRSPYGQLRVAEHSGHMIPIEQPDIVIQAIHDVWKEIWDHSQ
ncbi:MAG: alpha/beta fold hydrolase [Acidobacteriota bacterium]